MRKSAIRLEKTAAAPETIIERLWNVKSPTMGWIWGPLSSTVGQVGVVWCLMVNEAQLQEEFEDKEVSTRFLEFENKCYHRSAMMSSNLY